MKILFVAPSNSVHTTRWVRRAMESGIDVVLYDLAFGDMAVSIPGVVRYEVIRNARHYGVVTDLFEIIQNFRALRKIQKEVTPDLVHLHWLFHGTQVAAALLPGVKKIATPWGSDIQVAFRPIKGRLRMYLANKLIIRTIVKNCAYFCCDSINLRNILLKNGAADKLTKIIYFGTDLEKFSPENRSTELRAKFGASNGDILVISNRSHEEVYDIPTLFRAAAILKKTNPEVKYVVAGSGSLTDELKSEVESLGLSGLFYFTGKLNDHEFISATATCDIYVSTSKSDGGLAASTAEAMACEIPVVISEFGENGNWLANETAGFLFEIGNEIQLASRIKQLAESQELREAMGKTGRGIISTKNNASLEWKKVLNLYHDALAKS